MVLKRFEFKLNKEIFANTEYSRRVRNMNSKIHRARLERKYAVWL